MGFIDFWFLLWGIVAAFFVQVIYDGIGEATNRKFFGGLLITAVLTVAVVLIAYPLGLFEDLGTMDTVLTWVVLTAAVVITIVLFLVNTNKVDLAKYRKQSLKSRKLEFNKPKT